MIGIDAGGTKLLGGVVDEQLDVGERVYRRWGGGGTTEVIETMIEAVEEAIAAAPDASAVGFGVPALIDFESGTSVTSVHLPLDGVAIRDLLAARLGLPVHLDNDANLAALAEHRYGAARGARNVVLLTIGTGIGGGLILRDQVYRGTGGAAAELGHMTVDLDGPPCQGKCPNRGCLEVMASGRAIGREGERVAEQSPDSALGRALAQGVPITGEFVTARAIGGDAAARSVIELIGERLGAGLVGMVNVFSPEVIVIGGGASAAGELLLEPARRVVSERALRPSRDSVRIVPAHLGEDAGMIGAAAFALADGHA
ncbi:MAG: hypothetical protein NVSMB25_15500 [Thermoleophilaceae bacterium]